MYRTIRRVLVLNRILPDRILLEDQSAIHHLVNVLRVTTGDEIRIFNEIDGEWLAKVSTISKKKSIELSVMRQLRVGEPKSKISIAFALIKPDRMKFIIEKATEIGVSEFIPLVTDRCVVRSLNKEKLDAYIVNAVEQSERLTVPVTKEAHSLQDFLDLYKSRSIIFCNELEEKVSVREIANSDEDRLVLIGPEGGFADREREMVLSYPSVKSVYLTKNILRSETAAIFALSNLI